MTSSQQLAVQTERFGDVHRITPVGELDIATAPLLAREFEAAASSDAGMIVVDLGQLTFIDSSGIHVLIAMDCACMGEQRLRLIAGSPTIEHVLEIAGVRGRLAIIPREDSPALSPVGAASGE